VRLCDGRTHWLDEINRQTGDASTWIDDTVGEIATRLRTATEARS
jgi:hypothetical protein